MRTIFFTFLFSVLYLGLSAQEQLVLKSNFLNQPDTVWVFIPENSGEEEDFPLLYLLHGWSGNYQQWNNIIDCQTYADQYGFIIVCPDGLYDSWYIDSPVETENKYEQFFMQDLVPAISKKFNVSSDEVFITGLSMGGHGALFLFEKYPAYFKSAGSLSGLLDLSDWGNHYGISRVFGLEESKNNEKLLAKYSVAGNLNQLKKADKKIIVSCGTEDPFYEINLIFSADCAKNNIDVQFIKSNGGHDGSYWKSAVVDHFRFFKQLTE